MQNTSNLSAAAPVNDALVLIVDDNKVNIAIIQRMLKRKGYRVATAYTGKEALAQVAEEKPDVILLDVMMPVMDGFETCRVLKSQEDTSDIPIIFLSALDDTESKVKGFDVGGVDYITKPFHEPEVMARVNVQVRMRLLEQEQLRNIDALKELNEEKDKMMQIVSHDLRSPLGGIKGLAEILRDGEEAQDAQTVREFSTMMCTSVESLIGLVNDLLDLAKIESGAMSLNLSEFELRELALSCVESLQMIALSKGVNIVMEFGDADIVIRGDRPKLMQVLNNLLSNAVKFTPQGQSVYFTIKERGDEIEVVLRDTGIGIPSELLPHLFEKFGRHQRPGTNGEKGTGLGMPIVKRFVKLHGGSIDVHSVEQEGSTFTISVPRTARSVEDSGELSPTALEI